MAKHVKRSVVPIYLVGVVWLVFALFFSLHTPADYLVCAAVSVAAFVAGKAIFPDKQYQMPGEEQPKQEKKQEKMEPPKGNTAGKGPHTGPCTDCAGRRRHGRRILLLYTGQETGGHPKAG